MYLLLSGLPKATPDHADKALGCAVALMSRLEAVGDEAENQVSARIGISTGPAFAGILGEMQKSYEVWGDAVVMATQIASNGQMSRVQVQRGHE